MADDDLAYGEYHGEGGETDRGFLGDTFKRLAGRRPQQQQPGQPNVTQLYQPQLYNQPPRPTSSQSSSAPYQQSGSSTSGGSMAFLFDKMQAAVHQVGSEIKNRISIAEVHSHTHASACHEGAHDAYADNRFLSFSPQREGNDAKWYVDGCGYMWAVSKALEEAKESIWILDWWLSPELYLRRPPAQNEKYRVDNMLKAAAERGVRVNIIVYKEVTQALTRKYLNPSLPDYLHSLLPSSTDRFTQGLTRAGLWATFKSLEHWEKESPLIEPPISVSSSHTKHALEDCHQNICVFRHPDHLPDKQNIASDFMTGLQNIKLNAASLVKLPADAVTALYGTTEDTVLYWAHHEKLCLIDGRTAFMGGLDLCFGRWDTNQHSIADAHPGDINKIVFAGQDYNNSRIMDFQDVQHWQNNKLDRTQNSRMGWSDLSICLSGPVVEDLKEHFVQRWNFIYDEKYNVREDVRYCKLAHVPATVPQIKAYIETPQQELAHAQQSTRVFHAEEPTERGLGSNEGERGLFPTLEGGFREKLKKKAEAGMDQMEDKIRKHHHQWPQQPMGGQPISQPGMNIQLNRSCAKWSNGCAIEHSIANAYIEVIKNSQHFVYIENQFFITATSDAQKPIKNKIGAAIVERIVRAARNGENYKMIVVMPAVPAFAGDLRADDALGTRAIMEFQYDSISRGGHSIYESIAREGFNPMDYIRFYNLRNYDRINSSGAMAKVEQAAGVSYEDARKQYDDRTSGGFVDGTSGSRGLDPQEGQYQPYRPQGVQGQSPLPTQQFAAPPAELPTVGGDQSYYPPPPPGPPPASGLPTQQHGDQPPQEGYGQRPQYPDNNPLDKYQQAAQGISGPLSTGRWDSVAECYMLNGEDIRNVPWEAGNVPEIDAFVTEELYIHSKLLIADDRIVICGSANLNDRSQLGDHDSEIAVVIEDHNIIDSRMAGVPWRCNKFAATLRRQLFRKHLGLLKPQDYQTEGPNYLPVGVPNEYDFGSEEDSVVVDPLDGGFLTMWNTRARTNTEVFGKVFHPVPHDSVKTWKAYDEWYEKYFKLADPKIKDSKPGPYKVGHVVSEFFPGGVAEVKEELAKVKGTLVEMPLLFLKEEDMAKEGLGFNAFVEDLYT